MENREKQGLGLSPWRSATILDEFWDRGLEDNPRFPISVAPAIDEIVDYLSNPYPKIHLRW